MIEESGWYGREGSEGEVFVSKSLCELLMMWLQKTSDIS